MPFLQIKIQDNGDGVGDGVCGDGVEKCPVEHEEQHIVHCRGDDGGSEELGLQQRKLLDI